jgi:Na+/serine symporter
MKSYKAMTVFLSYAYKKMKMIGMLETEPVDAVASVWLIVMVHDNTTHGQYGATVKLLHLFTHISSSYIASFTAAICVYIFRRTV